MHLRLFVLFFCSVLVACATTHPGYVAESAQKDLVVSVSKNTQLSDKFYYFLEFTMENQTDKWLDTQAVQVTFADENSEILEGSKLSSWIEGAELKLQKNNYNRALLLGSMATIGGVAAGMSNDTNVQRAGVAVAAGSLAASAAVVGKQGYDNVNSGVKGLNGTVKVPSTHILVPTKVPPQSFVRRWVVIEAPKQMAKSEDITLSRYGAPRMVVSHLKMGEEKLEIFKALIKDNQRVNK